jgi:hypothetical protein
MNLLLLRFFFLVLSPRFVGRGFSRDIRTKNEKGASAPEAPLANPQPSNL